ncbi:hypothetical protein T439DRAFT_312879 [Meredithblackwellia eburnea MCA 4105]
MDPLAPSGGFGTGVANHSSALRSPSLDDGQFHQPLPPPPTAAEGGWSSPPASPPSSNTQWADAPQRRAPSGLTPRSPQAHSSAQIRPRVLDADEDDHSSPATPAFSPTRTQGGAQQQVTRPPPQEGFVRIRIVGLDKNRRDVYLKFNAESNMPSFRNSTYRSISRSYTEFVKFAEAITATCPQSIIPALPLVQSSAATDDDDDRLVKGAFQRWVARITTDPAVVKDDELRNFVEGEFGYTPNTRAKRRTPSTFHFPRGPRLPGEQDDELTVAKTAMNKLEHNFGEVARGVEKVAKARRNAAVAQADVSDHLQTFATTETYVPLAIGIKKLARTIKVGADLSVNQATSEMVALGDAMSYQSANARSAKETLVSRDVILDEHRTSAKNTIAKRRNIERMKGSSSIKADRVDEALEELDEAKQLEQLLSQRLIAMSKNLLPSLRSHSRNTHEDVLSSLIDHARSSLMYEKQLLKELELVRPELHAIKKPEPGVYYHPVPQNTPTPPRTSSSQAMRRDGSTGSTNTSPTNGRGGVRQQYTQQSQPAANFGNPLGDDAIAGFGLPGSVGGPTMGGNAGRRSIRGMAKSVVVTADDKRQRVDARMAASMLANGF